MNGEVEKRKEKKSRREKEGDYPKGKERGCKSSYRKRGGGEGRGRWEKKERGEIGEKGKRKGRKRREETGEGGRERRRRGRDRGEGWEKDGEG